MFQLTSCSWFCQLVWTSLVDRRSEHASFSIHSVSALPTDANKCVFSPTFAFANHRTHFEQIHFTDDSLLSLCQQRIRLNIVTACLQDSSYVFLQVTQRLETCGMNTGETVDEDLLSSCSRTLVSFEIERHHFAMGNWAFPPGQNDEAIAQQWRSSAYRAILFHDRVPFTERFAFLLICRDSLRLCVMKVDATLVSTRWKTFSACGFCNGCWSTAWCLLIFASCFTSFWLWTDDVFFKLDSSWWLLIFFDALAIEWAKEMKQIPAF